VVTLSPLFENKDAQILDEKSIRIIYKSTNYNYQHNLYGIYMRSLTEKDYQEILTALKSKTAKNILIEKK
jgi:hypothetical protein